MGSRILVVDDLLPNRRLLEAKLKGEYYEVSTADSGLQALQIAAECPPDVILLDVMMPEMDGFECCIMLKKNPVTRDIPVVMVTALSDVEDRVQGLNAGADDFLTKPINDMALFARIRSLVRLKSITDELKLRDKTGRQLGSHYDNMLVSDISGSKVMIIDDDNMQAEQIKIKLKELDIDVIIVPEASDAVYRSEQEEFDLIMVSTRLRSGNGMHLCTHLRSQEKTRYTPLLIIIEDDDTDLLIKALDMGINDYLFSPIDSNEVIARAKIQVRRKKYQNALQESQAESLEMAIKDGLTSLYNRRYSDSHIKRLLANSKQNGKPLAVALLDVDHFKSVNDSYGHQSGDEILKELSERFMSSVRPTDLVARYGGEEFIIIMPNTSLKSAVSVAQRIRSVVEDKEFRLPVEPGKIHKTVSIGLALAKDDDTAQDLINRADKALYQVKNNGRNQVAVYPDDMSETEDMI
jgi:two-component system cell cycle response regulator